MELISVNRPQAKCVEVAHMVTHIKLFSVALFMLVRDQRESEMSPCIRALVVPKYRVLNWMAEGNIWVNVGDRT